MQSSALAHWHGSRPGAPAAATGAHGTTGRYHVRCSRWVLVSVRPGASGCSTAGRCAPRDGPTRDGRRVGHGPRAPCSVRSPRVASLARLSRRHGARCVVFETCIIKAPGPVHIYPRGAWPLSRKACRSASLQRGARGSWRPHVASAPCTIDTGVWVLLVIAVLPNGVYESKRGPDGRDLAVVERHLAFHMLREHLRTPHNAACHAT